MEKPTWIAIALLILSQFLNHAGAQEIELLGVAEIPGDATDKSGLDQELEPGLRHNLMGGISALDYLGHDDLYVALPDRGPKDGGVDWQCRFHIVRIQFAEGKAPVYETVETVMLKDGESIFPGLAAQYTASEGRQSRLDPEGVRVSRDGKLYLTDEYGPHLLAFNLDGKLLRRFEIPQRFQIENPGLDKPDENGKNDSGRQCNRGMECLAISSDQKRLFGLMQSPLLQDCRRKSDGKPTGLNCRLVEFEIESGKTREMLYHLDDHSNKLNEILALNDHEFLVIERDGEIGEEAKYKKIIKISTRNASEIQDLDQLPPDELPSGVTPVAKQDFIDLLDPKFGLAGDRMPEKIESLSFGPPLADGRKTLLVVSDNDFETQKPTLVFIFTIQDQ